MAAPCLSLVDARLDEMSDAPEESSEGSLRQLLKGATGYETQLTSSTFAPLSLSQVSSPTEEELGAWPDLSNVQNILEGGHERMLRGVDEYERIARDTPVEPYTDPITQRTYRQYLRLIKNLDRLYILRWASSSLDETGDASRTNQRFCQSPCVALATLSGALKSVCLT